MNLAKLTLLKWVLIFTMVSFGAFGFSEPMSVGSQLENQPTHGDTFKEEGSSGHGDDQHHDSAGGITHQMMILILQLAIIILAAKIGGEVFERYLKQPSVLGELAAGMLIGPYVLGPYISLFGSGALFPLFASGTLPVSPELYGVATVASIILLFMVGLETDFHQFMRYAGPGFAVGVGGVAGSFITGDLLYVWYSGDSFMSPAALFMGTVSTATSVGITARVLSEKKKLDSPEGTTILAGAVIDDVLGILILAVVGGIAASAGSEGQSVEWGKIGIIALKAFGFWLGATFLGILVANRLAKAMLWFRTPGSPVTLGLGLALLMAGIAETFGLAMIIGAYIMGLALSKEEIAHRLERKLLPVYACFVPVFFAVMGMLVNFEAMGKAFVFGLIYSLVAVVSKVLGSALPCYFVGFNTIGAARIGIGMLPRGEVALIVAGVGMSQGFIGQEMFGVVILMTLITTVMAPPMLVWLFKIPKEGHIHTAKESQSKVELGPEKLVYIDDLTWNNHELLISCLMDALKKRNFSMNPVKEGIWQFTGEIEGKNCNISLKDFSDKVHLKTNVLHHQTLKDIVVEAHEDAKSKVNKLTVKEADVV